MDLIINFTPTGMIPTKKMTPHVPVSPAEIIEDVHRAVEIGITMVHLHARDQGGVPTYKPEVYAAMIEGIRRFDKELIICVSLSGRDFKLLEQRAAPLDLDNGMKPDMGSLTLSSLNFNKTASLNAPDMVQALAARMKERGIMPELEAFDAGMINYSKYLIHKELLDPPYYFNLLFGNIACTQADLLYAGAAVRDLPDNSLFSFAGIGNTQLMINSVGIASGYGVRVGLEDNIWYDDDRTELATNAGLLRRIHDLAAANGRRIMSPADCRRRLDLRPGNGMYGRNVEKPSITNTAEIEAMVVK